jgi:hypothetical protein
MPVVSNAFTTGKPLTANGVTGPQSLFFIPAPRVFIKTTPDSVTAAPIPNVKANGVASNLVGWSDLGIVDGSLKITYTKKLKELRTGIDNYLRGAYVNEKGATLEFNLAQVDDTVMGLVTGLTASVVTSGSVYTFHAGQEDVQQFALLLLMQNKLDGKEWQWYHPSAFVNWEYADSSDKIVLKVSALLPGFTAAGQTAEEFIACTEFK